MQHIKENKWILTLLFVIAVILILATPLQRFLHNNPLTPGDETYIHLNNLDSPTVNFYEIIIMGLNTFLSLQLIIFGLPILFAMISLLLFYKIIRKRVMSELELYLSLGVFLLTPAFITMHLGLTIYSLVLVLVLAIINSYLHRSKFYLLFLFLLYLTMPFLGLLLFIILVLLTDIKKHKEDSLLLLISLGFTLFVTSFLSFVPSLFSNFSLQFLPNEMFGFLGAKYGFVLFSFILGFVGLHIKKNNLFNVGQRSLFSLLLVLSLFYQPLRIVFIPFIAFLTAKTLQDLIKQKWSIPYLKELTIILFICMLLFATVSGIKENNTLTPTITQRDAYVFLNSVKEKNPEVNSSKVLTDMIYVQQLTYFANLEAFGFDQKKSDVVLTNSLLTSRDYAFIKEKLQQEKIAFIYIDNNMNKGNFLERPEQGIQFVMEHNDNFKLIYKKNNQQIYYFTLWNGDLE